MQNEKRSQVTLAQQGFRMRISLCAERRRDRISMVHFRRLACFILGAWLAGGVFMDTVATQNFRSVDRLLVQPAAQAGEQFDKLGRDVARTLLRHQVSEQNRWYFEMWGLAEIGLGAALLMVLLFGSSETNLMLVVPVLMLLIAVAQRFALTPQMVV